jgi:hypothetical protein
MFVCILDHDITYVSIIFSILSSSKYYFCTDYVVAVGILGTPWFPLKISIQSFEVIITLLVM